MKDYLKTIKEQDEMYFVNINEKGISNLMQDLNSDEDSLVEYVATPVSFKNYSIIDISKGKKRLGYDVYMGQYFKVDDSKSILDRVKDTDGNLYRIKNILY